VRSCLNVSLLCVHLYGVLYIENSENVFINSSSLYILLTSNIECDCKLIMAGPLKGMRQRNYEEEMIRFGLRQ
jgi:hypothetical protein